MPGSLDDGRRLVQGVAAVALDGLAVALHVELLEVVCEEPEVVVVGKDRVGLGAPEVSVPDAEQRQQHRQVALEGSGAEVLVHGARALEQLAEAIRSDGEHQ